MDELNEQSEIHSFIVRLWVEETETGKNPPVWHGHITYVSSGERHYIRSLNEIPEFIQTHLDLNGGEIQ
jgi:hypothetical protein